MMRPMHTLEVGPARVTVDAADGGRMTSLEISGVELLGGVGPGVVDHGSFVMAPWAGRIRDGVLRVAGVEHHLPTDRTHPHAGHGLVMDRPWTAPEADRSHLLLRCDLDRRWPHPGHVLQELRLTGTQLDQRIEVHAHDAEFPATVGWHPWFRRILASGQVARLALDVGGMLVRDPTGIPSGEVVPVPPGPWDDCFTGVRWPVTISWPGVLSLQITADVDFAVVYDERDEAFCVEPQSGPPDGPNTDPAMVRPGAPLAASMRWTWG
jgi:galactose mutarotase-like enzyme